MPTPEQQDALLRAIAAIRSAESLIKAEISAATDTLTAIKLSTEYNHLDSYLSELVQTRNAADDARFLTATQQLQGYVKGLQADEATMKSIVKDVQTAGQIIAYIGDALGAIAKL